MTSLKSAKLRLGLFGVASAVWGWWGDKLEAG